jgi:hypothetical protein
LITIRVKDRIKDGDKEYSSKRKTSRLVDLLSSDVQEQEEYRDLKKRRLALYEQEIEVRKVEAKVREAEVQEQKEMRMQLFTMMTQQMKMLTNLVAPKEKH